MGAPVPLLLAPLPLRLLLLPLFFAVSGVGAHLNLFITPAEMNRTLGLATELVYVSKGAVNAYSTKFPLRVGTDVSHVLFSWNASRPTRYSVRAEADAVDVLPLVHLPPSGTIPVRTETFAVEYRCAGSRAGQFLVSLHFNLSANGSPLLFTLRQEKLCAMRDGRRLLDAPGVESNSESAEGSLRADQLLYLSGCVLVLLLLLTMLLTCLCVRSRRRRGRKSTSAAAILEDSGPRTPLGPGNASQPFLTSTPIAASAPARTPPTFPDAGSAPRVVFERAHPVDVKAALAELTADRHLFQVLWTELEGTFGEVRWAVWQQTRLGLSGDVDEEEDGASEELAVVCKTLKPTADKSQFQRFVQEALMFHHVPTHSNLAQPVAAATYGDFAAPESVADFPLLCYRHQGFGNLKKFLQRCRGPEKSRQDTPALRTHELLSMGVQVLKAVQHLHKYGLLHKDVATRNCLVSELPRAPTGDRLYVQLADSALSRDLFPHDYDCLGDNENRPLRWMAPEAIRRRVHSSATDVWGVGVTVWELFTSGQQPFGDIGAEEVVSQVERGVRLGQPYCCPDDLYAIMFSCWAQDPLERPTASQLLRVLEDFKVQLKSYI